MKICKQCGKQFEDNVKFCTSCGTRLEEGVISQPQYVNPTPPKKSKAPWIILAAGVAAVLLGTVVLAGVFLLGKLSTEEEAVMASQEETEVYDDEEEETLEAVTEEESEVMGVVAEEPATEVDESAWEEELNRVKRYNAFNDVVHMLYYGAMLPDAEIDRAQIDSSNSYYSITDIDQDGKDELLLEITGTDTADMMVRIYDVDESRYELENDAYICELTEFPDTLFYDNGVAIAHLAHNQSMGVNIWPYNLYTYDAAIDTYVLQFQVECWEKEYAEQDYNGNDFPDVEDTDGDGTLFCITDVLQNDVPIRMDGDAYDAWVDSYIGDASEVEVEWKTFENTDVGKYADDYVDTYRKFHDEISQPVEGIDIGREFMENRDFDAVVQRAEDAGLEIVNMEMVSPEINEADFIGLYEGEEVFSYAVIDLGHFEYKNHQVEGMSILGIYPGMKKQEAIDILESYGFYNAYNDVYITGRGSGNFQIGITVEGDEVTEISMTNYFGYAN